MSRHVTRVYRELIEAGCLHDFAASVEAEWLSFDALKKRSLLNETELIIADQPSNLSVISQHFAERFQANKRTAAILARSFGWKAKRQIDRQRCLSVGITKAEWVYGEAGRVPCQHQSLDGKTYKISDGIHHQGRMIFPGEEYGCYCISRPVIKGFCDGRKAKNHPSLLRRILSKLFGV